ncbi:MAG: hypothetical protein ACPG5L_15845 [Vibrio gallaecicus]
MKTTSDVSHIDPFHDRFIISHLPVAETFSHVAIKQNLRCHLVLILYVVVSKDVRINDRIKQ